jgi:hypothetical protein
MRLSIIFLPLMAMALLPAATAARDSNEDVAQAGERELARAYIPFANKGGLWDWHADGSEVIYFQDRRKQWYRAELMSRAHDLPFVQHIGLDTGPSDRLDKWSTIYVRGQRYVLSSFEPVPGEKPWQGAEAGGNS